MFETKKRQKNPICILQCACNSIEGIETNANAFCCTRVDTISGFTYSQIV